MLAQQVVGGQGYHYRVALAGGESERAVTGLRMYSRHAIGFGCSYADVVDLDQRPSDTKELTGLVVLDHVEALIKLLLDRQAPEQLIKRSAYKIERVHVDDVVHTVVDHEAVHLVVGDQSVIECLAVVEHGLVPTDLVVFIIVAIPIVSRC